MQGKELIRKRYWEWARRKSESEWEQPRFHLFVAMNKSKPSWSGSKTKEWLRWYVISL